ncbi:HAMP domain-containing sensor histidine kinase [Neobacillus sp. PS2-9]|uniref:sensor histidine kinase n=1 Tax=Neobacillus sp. PS2-9 TaxID=3070676 RepID=UPI0027DEEA43|nr:HAMP domain-containing sensor histidine kinase [Neobacillus sp. PS2-9]WML57043.1 HAMP domain-containing sensor histidine kinase [Neobacillus sp. PS2-9]
MKLRNKINLYTAVLFASLIMIMNISVYLTFSKLTFDSELDIAAKELRKTTNDIARTLGTAREDELLRSYVPINGMIQIVTANHKKLASVTSPTGQILVKQKPIYYKGEITKFIVFEKKTYAFDSMPIVLLDGSVGNLQVTKSLETAKENLSILRFVLVMMTVLALIPVIISSRVLSKLIISPVSSLIETMREIRESGQFKRLTLEEKSKDELYQMGVTFNHMIDLLETNYEKQQQFVSNASHEFKTPITIIESYASLLKRRGLTEPKLFSESIEAIHSEAVRMKELTEQLLLLAMHHEHWKINKKSIDLTVFISQVIHTFESAYDRKVEYEQIEVSQLLVVTDEQKIKQLLFILLDNARKYSDEVISVITGVENEMVYIKVSDKGMGIPYDELQKVFDRFYRVDKARNRKKGGSGLGLAIAKEIADAIGVEIQIDSEEDFGTTATLYFKEDKN